MYCVKCFAAKGGVPPTQKKPAACLMRRQRTVSPWLVKPATWRMSRPDDHTARVNTALGSDLHPSKSLSHAKTIESASAPLFNGAPSTSMSEVDVRVANCHALFPLPDHPIASLPLGTCTVAEMSPFRVECTRTSKRLCTKTAPLLSYPRPCASASVSIGSTADLTCAGLHTPHESTTATNSPTAATTILSSVSTAALSIAPTTAACRIGWWSNHASFLY